MSDRKAYWQFDRDERNCVGKQALNEGRPNVDESSPMARTGNDVIGEKWTTGPVCHRLPSRSLKER